jgi:hypothetical protein
MRASTSASESGVKERTTCPVAGLTLAIAGWMVAVVMTRHAFRYAVLLSLHHEGNPNVAHQEH